MKYEQQCSKWRLAVVKSCCMNTEYKCLVCRYAYKKWGKYLSSYLLLSCMNVTYAWSVLGAFMTYINHTTYARVDFWQARPTQWRPHQRRATSQHSVLENPVKTAVVLPVLPFIKALYTNFVQNGFFYNPIIRVMRGTLCGICNKCQRGTAGAAMSFAFLNVSCFCFFFYIYCNHIFAVMFFKTINSLKRLSSSSHAIPAMENISRKLLMSF